METNQALKLRHDALLARLPVSLPSGSSQSSSPFKATLTPTLSPPSISGNYASEGEQWTTDEEVSFRIPSTTPSPVRSRANSSATLDSGFSPNHQRRISASPAALLALQETNNELITELTRLRSETNEAQVDGATRLRKLEQEIKGLRAELEVTQRTNAELEERVHAQKNDEQRMLYEERVRKFRQHRKSDPQSNTLREHKGFAPPPELQKTLRRASSIHIPEDAEESEPVCPNYEESVASVAPSVHSTTYSAISASEYAVVAQLYRKVEELQAANRELAAKNRTTKEQLSRAERNALEIKKVYDTIRAELGSDADTDADIDSASSDDDNNRVIRGAGRLITPKASMRSVRHFATRSHDRSEFVRSRRDSRAKRNEKQVDIEKTITPHGSSTSRAIGNKQMLNTTRLAKTRKPLSSSLFLPPSGPAVLPKSLPCSRSSSPVLTSSSALLTPRSQTPTGPDKNRDAPRRSPVTIQRTLGSELGSMDLAPNSICDPRSPAPTIVSDNHDFPAVVELRRLLDEDDYLNSVSSVPTIHSRSSQHPSIVLNSPNSRKATSTESRLRLRLPSSLPDTPPSFPTLAQRRISRRESALIRMASERENEFLSVARSVARSLSVNRADENYASDGENQSSTASSTPPEGVLRHLRLRSEDAMLELWLYLQFLVIMGFFLYTMAKRGPRDVMGLPPRRSNR